MAVGLCWTLPQVRAGNEILPTGVILAAAEPSG